MNNDKYEIIRNANNSRILVVRDNIDVNSLESITGDDFDAIFIVYNKIYVFNISLIINNLPVHGRNTWLKPVFLDTRFKKRFARYRAVVDGFVATPTDPQIDTCIREVEMHILNFGVNRHFQTPTSKEEMFINFCRYCLSRGETTMSNSTNRYYSKGYTRPLNVIFGENAFIDVRFSFQQNLRDLGYIAKTNKVEKLHVCPNCFTTQLIFLENCPKCKSTLLVEEPVIHHFRCANVSPESTYDFDGELRCPKCHRFLRHIGVEYDIPTAMFTCEKCGNMFSNSHVEVRCTNCKKTFHPEQLAAFGISEIEFTEKGRRAIVGDELRQNLLRTPFIGYSDFDAFVQSMLHMAYVNSKREGYVVMVVRYTLPRLDEGTSEMHEMMIQDLLFQLPSFKLSVHRNFLYLMQATLATDVDTKIDTADQNVEQIFKRTFGDLKKHKGEWESKAFVLHGGDNYDEFIKSLEMK